MVILYHNANISIILSLNISKDLRGDEQDRTIWISYEQLPEVWRSTLIQIRFTEDLCNVY